MLPNCPEMLWFDFACFRIGAVAVPVNTRYRRAEASYVLRHSGARLLLVDAEFLQVVDGLEAQLPALDQLLVRGGDGVSERDFDRLLATVEPAPLGDAPAADDPAVIFYTSGSTAQAKGVVDSHRTLLGTARVQSAIDTHPAVAESCVVGVPDPRHGAILKAFVELEPDAATPPTGEQLEAWLGNALSAYKVPVLWEFLPKLPRTATGKIDRKSLHALSVKP
jgi:acyl-CoA synthetase (AMP-forming)/AMP-acid ligase II